MKTPFQPAIGLVRNAGAGILGLAAAALLLGLPAQPMAQESGATGAAGLEYRLGEDPHDQPLLRRSLILDDAALRDIESRVDEFTRQREEKARRERIFFEDIERLDESPFN